MSPDFFKKRLNSPPATPLFSLLSVCYLPVIKCPLMPLASWKSLEIKILNIKTLTQMIKRACWVTPQTSSLLALAFLFWTSQWSETRQNTSHRKSYAGRSGLGHPLAIDSSGIIRFICFTFLHKSSLSIFHSISLPPISPSLIPTTTSDLKQM